MNFTINIFKAAFAFVQILVKNYNPFRNHLAADRSEKGGSTFFREVEGFESWLNLISTASNVEQVPGKDGATCYMFFFTNNIGYYVWTEPVGAEAFKLRLVHHQIQPVGIFLRHEEPTNVCTAVLTNENGKYALASVFPGAPDDPDLEGAKKELKEKYGLDWVEGTNVPIDIIRKYNIRVRSESEVDPA